MVQKYKNLIPFESQFLSVISQETRLKLLFLLKDGPKCLCELASVMDEDISTLSRHLNIMKNAGLLLAEKNGVKVIYKVKDERIFEILAIVDKILEDEFKERIETFLKGA